MSWAWKLAVYIFLLVFVVSCVFVVFEASRLKLQTISSWEEDHRGDCAVVLTGGAGRVREGFDLLQRGDVRKLIISGVNPNVGLLDIFPQRPFYPSVQNFNVILESHSRTTFGNVQQSLPLIKKLGCSDVLLVTSQLHMPRAYRLFSSQAPDYNFIKHSIYTPPTWGASFYEGFKKLAYEILF